jgi:hypothetical protein
MPRHPRSDHYLDLALYGLSAAFAGYTAIWSTLPAHRFWGGVALGGYLPAAIITVMLLWRYAVPVITRTWIAVACSVAVTVMPLLAEVFQRAGGATDRAQEEVLVVEESGVRLLDNASPYLPAQTISALPDPHAQLLAYNPYQPGMAVFGLPRAVFGSHWFTDARIWFAAATVAAVWAAVHLLRRAGATEAVRVRAVQAVGVQPICALTLATGGDDLPVVALCLLALAAMATDRPVTAGLAIGAAAALKLLAWPVLPVLLLLAVQRGQWRRFVIPALAIPAASLAPALLLHAGEFIDNVVEFPLGHGVVASTAASPLPGYLIANAVPGGRPIAIGLLALAALLIGGRLLYRPPRDPAQAAAYCALGLLSAIAFMPSSRFGYLLYPAVFGIWWWVLRRTVTPAEPWGPHVGEANPASAGG